MNTLQAKNMAATSAIMLQAGLAITDSNNRQQAQQEPEVYNLSSGLFPCVCVATYETLLSPQVFEENINEGEQEFCYITVDYSDWKKSLTEAAQDYLKENENYEAWNFGHDGASRICQLLFEEATDIRFFVGRAVNPAHQNPNLPISFHIKMKIVEELSEYLRKMGKQVQISYY